MSITTYSYVVEFYEPGKSEPLSLDIHLASDIKDPEELITLMSSKGYTLDVSKPFTLYGIENMSFEIDKGSPEYLWLGEAAIMNPFYGSNSIH